MKKQLQLLFATILLAIIFLNNRCKPSTHNTNNSTIDSVAYKKDDTLRKLFMKVYDKYTFDLKQDEDSLLIAYKPIIEQQSPMIQSAYYLTQSGYRRCINQFDSALYYAKKSVLIGCTDTAYAHKPTIAALSRLTVLYLESHQNDSALKYGYLGLNLASKYNHKLNEAYSQMVVLYQNLGDTINMNRVIWLSVKDSDNLYKPAIYNNLGAMYESQKKYDSAFYFMFKAVNAFIAKKDTLRLGIGYIGVASLYATVNKYDSAKYYANLATAINQRFDNEAADDYLLLGNIFEHDNNMYAAIDAYKKALALAKRDSAEAYIIQTHEKLAKCYIAANDYKNAAAIYDTAYTSLIKIKNNSFNNKINEIETDYRIKNKQLEIDNINAKKTATIKTVRLQKILLLMLLAILLIGILTVFQINKRRQLKIAKDKIESEKELIELEQRLLRSQMNPHFIFNAIAGIRGNILNNEKEKAIFYLTRFSKLLRQILENSTQVYISLTEEINTIENYIALQQMRYENKFTYEINIDKQIDTDDIEIPALLIQPFIENSIEHGFKGINYVGKINIDIQKPDDKILQIIIQDNGKGLDTTAAKDEVQEMKTKSLSLEIIQLHLAIISKNSGIPSQYTIKKDTEKDGVKVILQLGLK